MAQALHQAREAGTAPATTEPPQTSPTTPKAASPETEAATVLPGSTP
jgi:hypothetical protein